MQGLTPRVKVTLVAQVQGICPFGGVTYRVCWVVLSCAVKPATRHLVLEHLEIGSSVGQDQPLLVPGRSKLSAFGCHLCWALRHLGKAVL